MMHRACLSFAFVAAAGCSGKAIVDDPGSGGGGSSTTTSSSTSSGTSGTTSTTGTPPPTTKSCDQLTAELTQAIDQATACDACTDGPPQCFYPSGPQLTDTCGCPLPVSKNNEGALQKAFQIYAVWKSNGCGPFECGQPCAVSSQPPCVGVGMGCDGQCSAF